MSSARGHIDQALTNFSAGVAKNLDQDFIADLVAPPTNVANMSDKYWVMGDEAMRVDGDIISGGADVPRVDFTWSDDSFSCDEYGLETILKKAKLANADTAMSYRQTLAAGIVRRIKLELEVRVAAAYADTATFTNTAALAAADRWDVDTSSPLAKVSDSIETIRGLIGVQPNTLVCGPHVWAHLKFHPDLTSRLQGLVGGTAATLEQAASVLGVDRIIVGRAVKITSKQGATTKTRSDVWGKIAALCYIDPAGSGDNVIAPVRRFRFTGFMPEFGTYEYDEGALKTILGVYACYDLKTIAATASYVFTTAVS